MKVLWFLDQDAIWTLIPVSSALWAMGGSGVKLIRRIGVPIAVLLYTLSIGINLWISISTAFLLFIASILPYGDKIKERSGNFYSLWLLFVGACYGLALLPLGIYSKHYLIFSLGCLGSSLSFSLLTLLSQKTGFPRWKFVEMITGALIGLIVCLIVLR